MGRSSVRRPFLLISLMLVPLLGDEGRDGGRGAQGRDGGPLEVWECPEGRRGWVSGGVTAERLLSGEECVEMRRGKEGRRRSSWI